MSEKLLPCQFAKEAGERITTSLRRNSFFTSAWEQIDKGIGKKYFENLFAEIITNAWNHRANSIEIEAIKNDHSGGTNVMVTVAGIPITELRTEWITPNSCRRCMCHLAADWSYCPECGTQQYETKNEPLTLDELKQMDGEPIWVETGEVSIREQIIGEWEILERITYDPTEVFWLTRRVRGFLASDYGTTWLAYRHKKEEGE